jgi:hypothetical protein
MAWYLVKHKDNYFVPVMKALGILKSLRGFQEFITLSGRELKEKNKRGNDKTRKRGRGRKLRRRMEQTRGRGRGRGTG